VLHLHMPVLLLLVHPPFQTHLRDFAVWLVAFLATLFLGIELGLAAAIGLALLIVIFESAFPHTAVLGRVDRTTVRMLTGAAQRECLLDVWPAAVMCTLSFGRACLGLVAF
jgi:MFS superfamily sulfate permease-like transporter